MTDETLFSDVRSAYRLLHRYHEAARDTVYRLNEAFGTWDEIGNCGFVSGHSSRRRAIITYSEYWIWDWLPYHSAHFQFSRDAHSFLTVTLCTDTSIFDPMTGKICDDLDKTDPANARSGFHIDYSYSENPYDDDIWELDYDYDPKAKFDMNSHALDGGIHRFRQFLDLHDLGSAEAIDEAARRFRKFVKSECREAATLLKPAKK